MPRQRHWRKSSFSGDSSNCLNLADSVHGGIRLRESDAPEVILATTPAALGAFIRVARRGDLDRIVAGTESGA